MKKVTMKLNKYFRESRNAFIGDSIDALEKSQTSEDGTCWDFIDSLVDEKRTFLSIGNPYRHLITKSDPNDIDVGKGEPDLVNPSWFESISNILQNLSRRAGIKSYVEDGKRAWVY